MGSFISMLESQFAWPVSVDTKFYYLTKITIITGTLNNIDEFEPLVTSESVMKKADHLWKQMFTLFIEKAIRLQETSSKREQ